MPSLFAELEARASEAVDYLYGEPLVVKHTSKGDFSGIKAAGRAPYPVTGVLDINPTTTQVADMSANDGLVPILPGEKIHVSFDLSLFPDPLDIPVEKTWIFTERTEWPKLEVEYVKPDGIGRIVCVCRKTS